MRILLVTPAFAPVVTAHSERAVALARLFKREGHYVEVATLSTFQDLTTASTDERPLCDRLLVSDLPLHRTLKNRPALKLIRLAFDLLWGWMGPYTYEARALRRLVARYFGELKPDLVWVTTPPHELQIVGEFLRRVHLVPYVMDLRDPWGESQRIRWLTPLHRFVSKSWYERCLRAADVIISNTPQHDAAIRGSQPDAVVGKLRCLPNGFFEEDFPARNALVAEGASPSLLYAGSLYGGRAEAALGQVLHSATESGVKLTVSVVGAGSGRYDFEYRGRVPASAVPSELARGRWLFLYMPESADKGPVMSLKAYQYARSGRPILYFGPKNETFEFLEQHATVVHCENLTEAVQTLARTVPSAPSPELRPYSWEARAPVVEDILQSARARGGVASQ